MAKLVRTKTLNRYLLKLLLRISIFVTVLVFYLTRKELLVQLMTQSVYRGITALHLLWLFFMIMMIRHLIPPKVITMALRKADESVYVPTPEYSKMDLYEFVQGMNVRAWMVLLVWLIFNGLFGLLYLFGVIGNADLLMVTVFFFLCDYICILFFCPFQTFIMKNRCCVNCRIYDWGHFMMFTPMLFIRNFFSWSLFFTSVVVLIHWELIYAQHPERFWFGSNQNLQCQNCKDKTCQIKKKLAGKK